MREKTALSMGTVAPVSGLLSVVVPMYNVERYLFACLNSLSRQNISLQVIMVDDGSTDGSQDIAHHFVKTDARFQLLIQPHGGLSQARNTGVDEATGEFLAFCDADDLVPDGAYENSTRILHETSADFVSGNVLRFNSKEAWPHPRYRDVFGTDHEEVHITVNRDLILDRMAWNKVFRRKFWDEAGLEFELSAYEDAPVMLAAHLRARAVSITSSVAYHWRVRDAGPRSITQRLHEPENIAARMRMALESARVVRQYDATLLRELGHDITLGDFKVLLDAVTQFPKNDYDQALLLASEFVAALDEETMKSMPPENVAILRALQEKSGMIFLQAFASDDVV
ncbi:glycosyltransferase [Microbacterium suaedae]|uniref:glycosyltransferase n=1 Tax=Microbacterium suaedae TaxID=2067813 RepID=UPI000DA1343B|nr:glycosyltransferase [Microbacterium suaedae]